MTAITLKSFVDRLENLDEEQKGIGTDKRDVLEEAEAAGYDKKAIRRLLRDRREAAKDKGTAELAERYAMLLNEPGATYRSVAEKTGAKRSTLHRLVQKTKNGTGDAPKPDIISPPEVATLPPAPPAHDPETGEIEEETALVDIAPTLPPKHADAIGAVLDDIAAGGDGLDIPPHLDRRPRASA